MTVVAIRPATEETEEADWRQVPHPSWCCAADPDEGDCSSHMSPQLAFVAATGGKGEPVEQAGLAVFPAVSVRAYIPEGRSWRTDGERLVDLIINLPIEHPLGLECGDRHAEVELEVRSADALRAALLSGDRLTVTAHDGHPWSDDTVLHVERHVNGVAMRVADDEALTVVLRPSEAAELARGIAVAVSYLTEPIAWWTFADRHAAEAVAA